MPKGYVISDLHMFRDPPIFNMPSDFIKHLAEQSDLIILNGDIFDLEWTSGDKAFSVGQSIEWTQNLITAYPECDFVFIAGNHDWDPLLAERMNLLTGQYKNFTYRQEYYTLPDKIFLHGDVIHTNRLFKDVHRWRAFSSRIRNGVRRYRSFASFLIPPNLVHHIYCTINKKRIFDRLIAFVQKTIPNPIREIYFGHTHQYYEQHGYKGYMFSNPGAAIKGEYFKAIAFDYHE